MDKTLTVQFKVDTTLLKAIHSERVFHVQKVQSVLYVIWDGTRIS